MFLNSTEMFVIFVIILLLITSLFLSSLSSKIENFDDFNNIEYYVITLGTRNHNIQNQQKKLKSKINIIDGFHWKNINQQNLLDNNIISQNFFNDNEFKVRRNKEIGCYLSHFYIYNQIKKNHCIIDNSNKKNFSVIFEDDFNILSNDLHTEINNILHLLKNIDFDILFLGNLFDNIGSNHTQNIHNIDKNKNTKGTYAYLINNKKINKILNSLNYIDEPIDEKFNSLIKTNNIIAYVINPNIVNYMAELDSLINQ